MTPRQIVAAAKGPAGRSYGMLAFGLVAFAFSAFGVVAGDVERSTVGATAALSREAGVARERVRAMRAAAEASKDRPPLSSVPAFIDRVGALAKTHGADVRAIRPVKDGTAEFSIAVGAPYRDLLAFVAALEEMDVAVVSFEARHDGLTEGTAAIAADIVIRPRNDARQLTIPRLAAVREELEGKTVRNPFQALIAPDASGSGQGHEDLSGAYRLTGVATLQPSGQRIATIDLLDYVMGDVLDGREVVYVAEDRVLLRSLANAEERYVIRMTTGERPAARGRSAE